MPQKVAERLWMHMGRYLITFVLQKLHLVPREVAERLLEYYSFVHMGRYLVIFELQKLH